MLFFDEQEAIKELQSRGYRVVKEDYPDAGSINTLRELVDYFYSRRRFYNPDRKFPYSIDYTDDVKTLSTFIRSRQKLGLGRKDAVREAAILVDAMFRLEKQMKLREPIISPSILSQAWAMDKVCSFLNGEVAEVGEYDTELYLNEVNEYYNKKNAARDFERAARERKKILEKLNEHKERE